MKVTLKMLLAGALTAVSMQVYCLDQFNLSKIANEIYTFAITTPTNNATDIENAFQKALSMIPFELLGFDISSLQNGAIDANIAARISPFIQQAKIQLDNAQSLLIDPRISVELAQAAYNKFAQSLPISIKDVLLDTLNLAKKVANSDNVVDQQGIAGIKNVLNNVQQVLNNIAAANAAGKLVGYNIQGDINVLRDAIRVNFEAIKAVIENNIGSISALVQKATTIKLSDLSAMSSLVDNEIQNRFGIDTSKLFRS